jgi:hypothetical protein
MTLSTVNAHDVTKLSARTTDLGDNLGSSLTITAHSEDHQGKHRTEFVVFSDDQALIAEFERIATAVNWFEGEIAAAKEANRIALNKAILADGAGV